MFLPTIKSKLSSLHLFSVNGVHINPLPWVAIKLIMSGEADCAEHTKSPSFSLSSSSNTITILPCLISVIASSILSNIFSFKINKFKYYLTSLTNLISLLAAMNAISEIGIKIKLLNHIPK